MNTHDPKIEHSILIFEKEFINFADMFPEFKHIMFTQWKIEDEKILVNVSNEKNTIILNFDKNEMLNFSHASQIEKHAFIKKILDQLIIKNNTPGKIVND